MTNFFSAMDLIEEIVHSDCGRKDILASCVRRLLHSEIGLKCLTIKCA